MTAIADQLRAKIERHDALVGIIGLGYVGLPLALAFAERGFRVLGFDVDPRKVEAINRGESYIKHLDVDRLRRATGHASGGSRLAQDGSTVADGRRDSGRAGSRPGALFTATADFARLSEPDAILICVPTPLTPQRDPDMTYVRRAAYQIRDRLRPGQLVVLESTTYPGTTDELMLPILRGRDQRGARRATDALTLSPDGERPPGGAHWPAEADTAHGWRPDLDAQRSSPGHSGEAEHPSPCHSEEGRRPDEESGRGTDNLAAASPPPGSLVASAPRDDRRGGDAPRDDRRGGDAPRDDREGDVPRSGILECGADFFLAFSPEREDPGNPTFGPSNTPKVVGGVDPVSGDLAEALYAEIVDRTVRVSSARVAEASKLIENIFRATNIALVNELKVVYEKMGIDIWEVLDAAETKPFGFMRFNPGPGLGGHCIVGSEWLRVRGAGLAGVYRAADLFKRVAREAPAAVTRNGVFVEPADLEALALDASTGDVAWYPVTTLYRGRYDGPGRQITTEDRRRLIVTSEHPMLVFRRDRVETVAASDLSPGDVLPVVSDVGRPCDNPIVDLVDVVPVDQRRRVWVRVADRPWSADESILKARFGWTIRDAIRNDSLRLDRFLEVEAEIGSTRDDLVLMTGKGRARREWPARLELTPDFARFVGYYLAEGCITEDRNAARVRLTFHRDETEYIDDARDILERHGFPTSIYHDRAWRSSTIKASSLLLVWLLDSAWSCGRRSEEMRIPDRLFELSPAHKWQLLSGLLRGDGDVWARAGRSTYNKGGRRYSHHNATATVGFFSSSQVLLEQVIHLLQDLGFQPSYKRWKHQIRLSGPSTIDALIPFFAGDKRARLEQLRKHRRRRVTSRSDRPPLAPGLSTTVVKAVDDAVIDGWVYSMEVGTAGSFTTSSGIAVHNCLPIDPFYLSWKAREAGVPTRFIELAGEINVHMPEYVVGKIAIALNDRGRAVKGARVLVLGLAYKKNVDDPRESPAFEIIDLLLERGAEVSYHDPHIPNAPRMRSWPDLPPLHSVDLTAERLQATDAVVIVTDHAAVDYDLVAENAPLVVDTRGVLRHRNTNIVKA